MKAENQFPKFAFGFIIFFEWGKPGPFSAYIFVLF